MNHQSIQHNKHLNYHNYVSHIYRINNKTYIINKIHQVIFYLAYKFGLYNEEEA